MKGLNAYRQPVFCRIAPAIFCILTNIFITMAQSPVPYLSDTHLTPEVKQFLKGLNEGGKPLESLSPAAAKKVLENAQASIKADLSGIEVTRKTITTEGFTIPLYIVRPTGTKIRYCLVSFLSMAVDGLFVKERCHKISSGCSALVWSSAGQPFCLCSSFTNHKSKTIWLQRVTDTEYRSIK